MLSAFRCPPAGPLLRLVLYASPSRAGPRPTAALLCKFEAENKEPNPEWMDKLPSGRLVTGVQDSFPPPALLTPAATKDALFQPKFLKNTILFVYKYLLLSDSVRYHSLDEVMLMSSLEIAPVSPCSEAQQHGVLPVAG